LQNGQLSWLGAGEFEDGLAAYGNGGGRLGYFLEGEDVVAFDPDLVFREKDEVGWDMDFSVYGDPEVSGWGEVGSF